MSLAKSLSMRRMDTEMKRNNTHLKETGQAMEVMLKHLWGPQSGKASGFRVGKTWVSVLALPFTDWASQSFSQIFIW